MSFFQFSHLSHGLYTCLFELIFLFVNVNVIYNMYHAVIAMLSIQNMTLRRYSRNQRYAHPGPVPVAYVIHAEEADEEGFFFCTEEWWIRGD